MELSEEDSDRVVTLATGDTVIIRLASNPGTGFEWVAMVTDENVVAVVSQQFADQDGDEGSPGQEVISLVAGQSGTAEVSLEYRRPWETDVEPEETMTIEVVVSE
ncbi:MAG: protease inhibitor I42 family protein [Acidimicrobiales bacterium]